MDTLIVAALSFVGFIVAYNTYGKWLGKKIFNLDEKNPVPSKALQDDVDYCPTKKEIIFGHHFTSIAGTGPIVGPAIAIFWGWLPALLWVVFGSIFIGAVHDFGSLVVSMRNRGQTLGEIAGRMISPRAKLLLLFILFFALTIVLGIFGLVIAVIFSLYKEAVLSVWIEIPLAIFIGWWVYKKNKAMLIPSLLALAIMYLCIWIGTAYFPVDTGLPIFAEGGEGFRSAVVLWTVILFIYCFIASVLPVWTLLQPRDYINSHQLMLALGLLILGILVAGFTGQAELAGSAPAIAKDIPSDAPPIFPFLFITIACGAISGFHCLVSSGTSSKQVACETDAQYVGYGAMLLEGGLAVIVIIACTAGVGMGLFQRTGQGADYQYEAVMAGETQVVGKQAWRTKYNPVIDGKKGGWKNHKLGQKVGAFIEGGANLLTSYGIPLKFAIGIIAVLVASFAATTLDTATRLQRYVVQEIGRTTNITALENKYTATSIAVGFGLVAALIPGPAGPGSGGLILWPVFGATNQLLAGLAFLVIMFYLRRRNKPTWFLIPPLLAMIVFPTYALVWQMIGWYKAGSWILLIVAVIIQALQIWMLIEAAIVWKNSKGNYPEPEPYPSQTNDLPDGSRSC